MKNVAKRLLALAVALMMILAVVPMVVSAAPTIPTTAWWGNHDYSWYNTTDTSFEIDTPRKLAGLIVVTQSYTCAGQTFYITQDIDLGAHLWEGLSKNANGAGFRGNIVGKKNGVEGAAVTISNMIVSRSSEASGFIRFMEAGTIANITFDNAYVTSSAQYAVVCGRYRAAGAVRFENITVRNSELVAYGSYAGATGFIVAEGNSMHNTNNPITLVNCSVIDSTMYDKAATAHANVKGALVGKQAWGSIAFDGCKVLGTTITSQSTGAVVIGALVGSDDAGGTFTMKNCEIDAIGSFNAKIVGNGAAAYDITAPTMIDGASIRTTEGENGLRFTSVMNKADLDKLGATYSFGTVVAVANELTDGVTFTVAGLNAAGVTKYTTIKAVNGIYENYDGANGVKFNAALIDIADKATEFAARSYVDVTASGLTIRVYSAFDAAKNERSMEYVANKALNDVKDVKEEAITNGFAYCFAVSEYNSDATGTACTMTEGTKYSCYAPSEWEVLKTWSSAT